LPKQTKEGNYNEILFLFNHIFTENNLRVYTQNESSKKAEQKSIIKANKASNQCHKCNSKLINYKIISIRYSMVIDG
jgi:hypothetical protein